MKQLTKEMVPVPQMWRLVMELRPQTVEIVLNPLLDDATIIHESIGLDKSMEPLAAFEDLIYENPVLLSDFNRITIVIDTERFTIVPKQISNDQVQEKIIHSLWEDQRLTFLTQEIEGTDDRLLMAVDNSLVSFLHRTFLEARIVHPIALMASYFSSMANRGNSEKVYARVRPGWVDVISVDNGILHIANTFAAPTAEDISYYILAAAQTAGYDLKQVEFMIFGDSALRDAAMERMKTIAPNILPFVFPSEFYRSGATVQTPFELLIV